MKKTKLNFIYLYLFEIAIILIFFAVIEIFIHHIDTDASERGEHLVFNKKLYHKRADELIKISPSNDKIQSSQKNKSTTK